MPLQVAVVPRYSMNELLQAVVFAVETRRYAIALEAVERIVRAVEITRLPGAPDVVLGAVCVAGRVLPVLDLRRRFGLPQREITPADHMLIARTVPRTVVLPIDEPMGVLPLDRGSLTAAGDIVPGLQHVQGVARSGDDLIVIQDLEKFLAIDEARALDRALAQ